MYTFYYWPQIPGRGEFVRVVLQFAGVEFKEINDFDTIVGLMNPSDSSGPFPTACPPVLETSEGARLSNTFAIISYLIESHSLVNLNALASINNTDGSNTALARGTLSAMLATMSDLVTECHDTHHPVSVKKTFEEQIDEAKRRSDEFQRFRISKFLSYFDAIAERNFNRNNKNKNSNNNSSDATRWIIGTEPSAIDAAIWFLVKGLSFAFPGATERTLAECKNVAWIHENVPIKVANIKKYIESGKQRPFSDGIFRFYKELQINLD